VAELPFLESRPVGAAFLYGLCFLSVDKIISTYFGTRTRGVYRPSGDSFYPTRFINDQELPFVRVFGNICNIVGVYKMLKKYQLIKYVISISRVQSRITGYVCKIYVPYYARYAFFGAFSKMYGVKIEEAERDDFDKFRTFTDFFTRTLKPGVREIYKPTDITSMCSPCDGAVLTKGDIDSVDSTIDCVKGRSYRLDEFMLGVIGDETDQSELLKVIKERKNNAGVAGLLDKVKARGNKLQYMVIYLSPGDYLRFHSPAIHTAEYRRHIAGYLSPVKPSYVNKHRDVFKNNERVNIFGEWRSSDFFFLSYVGALNVGSICLDFDTDVMTNCANPASPYHFDKAYTQTAVSPLSKYIKPSSKSGQSSEEQKLEGETTGASSNDEAAKESCINFEKGEMTGRFEMGSTIVLIYEVPSTGTEVHVNEGEKVKVLHKSNLRTSASKLFDRKTFVKKLIKKKPIECPFSPKSKIVSCVLCAL